MTPPFRRRFRVSGLSLLFRCNVPSYVRFAREILEHHGLAESSGEGPADVTMELTSAAGSIAVPDDARRMTVHESGLEILYLDRLRFLTRGRACAKIDLSQRHVVAAVPPRDGEMDGMVGTDLHLMIIFSLIILLQDCGRYALHAAAVSTSSDQGILIVAESDSGKSTMTMNLVRQGWGYVSDDAVFLYSPNGLVEATALRRDFALDPDATALFPEIAATSKPLLTDPQKLQVQLDEIFPGMRLTRCTPRVLIFPELVGDRESRLEPVGARDAFLNLLRQVSFLSQETEDGASQTAVLNKLVRQTKAFRLEAGEDIKSDGQLLSDLMAASLTAAGF